MPHKLADYQLNWITKYECPADSVCGGFCQITDDEHFTDLSLDICRACWLKWFSEESEDNDE